MFQLKKTRFSASLPSNLAAVATKGKKDIHIKLNTTILKEVFDTFIYQHIFS